jgi:hypothetical protein
MPGPGYTPYAPIHTLKGLAEDLWIVDGDVVDWSYWPLPPMPFPTRMTVIRLPNGGLWIHSPVALTADLQPEIDALGPVAHLVSPNRIHHIWIGDWARAYPAAKTWASPGVRARADVAFTDDLGETAPPDWADAIDQRIAHGSPALEEVVFFHKPSRTLILTDLIENFERSRMRGVLIPFLMRIGGVMAPKGGTPRDVRLTFLFRHRRLRPTIDWMLSCDPERVILAHGRYFERDGRAEIARAFAWVR